MTTMTMKKTELVTRSIARWGSVAAAVIFAVAFFTDHTLSWDIVAGQYVHVLLVLGIFAGYALALTERFEVQGSIIALIATVALFLYAMAIKILASPLILLVGVPALFHLAAVILHRFLLRRADKPE